MTDDSNEFDSEKDPFEELDTHVGERDGDPFEDADGLFEEEEVPEIDPETVWEDVQSVPLDETVEDADTIVENLSSSADSARPQEVGDATVPTRSYCEQCEFFSAPPAIECQHPGTEILGFTDLETVRVRNCPVVAERQDLERK